MKSTLVVRGYWNYRHVIATICCLLSTAALTAAFVTVTDRSCQQPRNHETSRVGSVNLNHMNRVTMTQKTVNVPTQLYAWRLIGKYFQIEEMEDRDSCTTEVVLNPDSTVSTLETNGPLHKDATGSWELDKITGDFTMILKRTYEAGRESKIPTDVGVFTFTTIRKFVGTLYNIGIKQGIRGNIYDVTDIHDDNSDAPKVGYFEMIDTTLEEDGEVTIRGRTRSN